jgi:hypothetical protein
MIPARQVFLVALFLFVAAVLQGRVAHAIAIRGAQPDFILVVLACGGTLLGGGRVAGLGFWAGLLTGALIPGTVGTFLTSRTLAGAFAGWLHGTVIRDSIAVPPLAALTTTLVAEVVFVLMAPTHHLRTWAGVRGGELLYNSLLAVPVYFLLSRLQIGRQKDDPFALHSSR